MAYAVFPEGVQDEKLTTDDKHKAAKPSLLWNKQELSIMFPQKTREAAAEPAAADPAAAEPRL
eukprot:666699-Prymnesium_polylepis.1